MFHIVGISDSLGYIKLNSFTNSAHEEVKKSFLDLKQKGINKLILIYVEMAEVFCLNP